MWTWSYVALGIGALLILFEWNIARKKKGGISWTDKQQMLGILKVSVALAALAALLSWMNE